MIAPALAFSFLLLANPTSAQRSAYNECLEKFTIKSIEDKLEEAAFETAVATACAAEAEALRKAALAADLAAGRKAADSADMISGDIEDYQANAKDLFADFKARAEKPSS